jgi:hypothetical protein
MPTGTASFYHEEEVWTIGVLGPQCDNEVAVGVLAFGSMHPTYSASLDNAHL